MERVELIAEAKNANLTDSEIQLVLEYYDMCVREGLPTDLILSGDGALSEDEIDIFPARASFSDTRA